jgi:hypothetical protein
VHFSGYVPRLGCACHRAASLLLQGFFFFFLRSLALQTCWNSAAHPPLPVFLTAGCEWFLVENKFGDCGWLLITDTAVTPDLERICSIGSSTLAAELGASGRTFAAPCSWVSLLSALSAQFSAYFIAPGKFVTPEAFVAGGRPRFYRFPLRPAPP